MGWIVGLLYSLDTVCVHELVMLTTVVLLLPDIFILPNFLLMSLSVYKTSTSSLLKADLLKTCLDFLRLQSLLSAPSALCAYTSVIKTM